MNHDRIDMMYKEILNIYAEFDATANEIRRLGDIQIINLFRSLNFSEEKFNQYLTTLSETYCDVMHKFGIERKKS